MLTPLAPADSLIESRTHRHAFLWRMVRPDQVVFHFTSADVTIKYEGELYEPAGGIDPTAERLQTDLSSSNREAAGPITSDKITADDLRKGIWRDTEVTERIIDWQYPAAGALKTSRYWLTEGEWTDEVFVFTIEGGARWLKGRQGHLFTRNCRHALGDGLTSGVGCRVDLDAFTIFGANISAVASRYQFTAGSFVPGAHTRNRYRFGKVVWTAGDNDGLESEIKDYGQVGAKVIELFLPTPFPIQVSDTYDLVPGCDKIRSTCIDEYNQLTDFGGFPFMPGTNRMLAKPRSTAKSPAPRYRT